MVRWTPLAAAMVSAGRSALKSAVIRPQSGHYPGAIPEAAALWESLSQNHPFIVGDKRIAIASMAAHLAIDGSWLREEELAAYRFMMELYTSTSGRFRMSELEPWLRTHAVTGSSGH